MSAISVTNFSKNFSVYKKEPGLRGFFRSLFARKYETVEAVKNISFTIEEGELVGFIGPNGAGKTTTLKSLAGLLYPTEGEIKVLGYNPFERRYGFLQQISFVMGQKNQLWWELPCMDSFLLNKEIYNVSDNKFKEIIDDLSTLLEVKDFLYTPVRKLSLGQRMKMEVIAALIHSPKVLFLDEPTIGLDVVMQKNLREFIGAYNKKYKATIILTSHYMKDVEALCKRVIIIHQGKILFDGQLANLVKKHSSYKLITIVLREYVDPKKIALLGDVKEFLYPQLILKVSNKNTHKIVSKILQSLPIEDITITDPEIEEIIRDVFSKAKV
ncbi:MAG: ABC transporter ATP-binding protein [Candidatus Levyibacteriota bacterium]